MLGETVRCKVNNTTDCTSCNSPLIYAEKNAVLPTDKAIRSWSATETEPRYLAPHTATPLWITSTSPLRHTWTSSKVLPHIQHRIRFTAQASATVIGFVFIFFPFIFHINTLLHFYRGALFIIFGFLSPLVAEVAVLP